MKIEVASGTGQGATELGAYDAATAKMGVENYNQIRLSSVIPSGWEVVEIDGRTTAGGTWGDKLYCVAAEKRTSLPGEEAWAGIGWIMLENGKQGLFCEHDGKSRDTVERHIRGSLMSYMENRGLEPDEGLIRMKVAGAVCKDKPVCALVIAIYRAESW